MHGTGHGVQVFSSVVYTEREAQVLCLLAAAAAADARI